MRKLKIKVADKGGAFFFSLLFFVCAIFAVLLSTLLARAEFSVYERQNLSRLCETESFVANDDKAHAVTLENSENVNNYLLINAKNEKNETYDSVFSSELSSVLDDFYELISEFDDGSGEIVGGIGVESALGSLMALLSGEGGEIGSFFLMLFGIAMLFAVAEKLSDGFGESKNTVLAATGAVLSLPVVNKLTELIFSAREGLLGACRLFSGLIPVFTSISAIGGGAATSVAQGSGMSITLSVCSFLICDGLLPMLMLMLALGLLSSFESGGVSSLVKGIKGSFMFILGAVTTVTAGVLALQSVITNATDSMALRSAKFAISGMIPIVGGNISSALGALASGVDIAKGTVGATALIVLIGILALPLFQLLLVRMCFRLCVRFLEMTGGSLGVKTLSSLQEVLDALISIIAFSGVIYILEIITFLKLGVPCL